MTRTLRALYLGLICALALSCARASHEQDAPAVQRGGGDPVLAQWLNDLRLAHSSSQFARLMHKRGDQEAAFMVLTALAKRAPATLKQLDEGPSLLRDVACDAAELALQMQRFEDAQAAIDTGLAQPGEDAFRTQLWILAAENAHARGDTQAEARALAQARQSLAAPPER